MRPGRPARTTGRSGCRIIRLWGLVLAACLLQACGAAKIAYNQSPELAYWYLDGYLDFNGAQSAQVRDELTKLQAWHRQTQLPAYAETLQRFKAKMPGDLDAAQACEVVTDMRSKLLAVSDHAQPAVLAIAAGLSTDQLQHMERRFAKNNDDYRRDFIEAPARSSRNKRFKMALRRAEMLYGQLDDRQREVLGQTLDQSRFDAGLSYAERTRRQSEVLQALRALTAGQAAGIAAVPADATRAALRALFDRSLGGSGRAPGKPQGGTESAYLESLTEDSCRGFATLHNSTSAAQRGQAIKNISRYEQDLQALIAQH